LVSAASLTLSLAEENVNWMVGGLRATGQVEIAGLNAEPTGSAPTFCATTCSVQQAEVGLPVYDMYSMITRFHAGLRPRVFA
jgi:hypothetical protein